jgi:hypothetical protein
MKNFVQFLQNTLTLTTVTAVIAVFGFVALEPATSTAQSTASTSFTASLTVDEEITLTDGGNITMGTLDLSTDSVVGSTGLTVETNADAGYTMDINAAGTPAMVGTNNDDQFADYTANDTPEKWAVDGSSKQFGYSVHSGDAISEFSAGSGCGTDADPSGDGAVYEGFNGTTPEKIAENSGATADDGNTTTLCVAAEQNGVEAEAGNYVANLTATATTK